LRKDGCDSLEGVKKHRKHRKSPAFYYFLARVRFAEIVSANKLILRNRWRAGLQRLLELLMNQLNCDGNENCFEQQTLLDI